MIDQDGAIKEAIIDNEHLMTALHQLTAFLALLLMPMSAGATTVAVVVSRDQIVIAADALSTSVRTDNAEPSQRQECKIGVSGHYVFATSGLVAEQRTGFSAAQLISESLRLCGGCSINQAAARVISALKAPLAKVWTSLLETMPEEYARIKDIGMGRLRFVIARYGESVEPQAVLGAINADGSVGVLPYEGGLSHEKVAVTILGSDTAILPFLERFLPDATSEEIGDLEGFARRLVQIEIDYAEANSPQPKVGPPINTAILNAGSFSWGDPSPTCSSPLQ